MPASKLVPLLMAKVILIKVAAAPEVWNWFNKTVTGVPPGGKGLFWYELKSVGVEPATGNPKLPAQVGVDVGVKVGVRGIVLVTVGEQLRQIVEVIVGERVTVTVGVFVGVRVIVGVSVIVGVKVGVEVNPPTLVGVLVEVQVNPLLTHPGKDVLVGVGVKVGSVVGV
jgi:hypothetical protein